MDSPLTSGLAYNLWPMQCAAELGLQAFQSWNQALSSLPHLHPDSPWSKLTDPWGDYTVATVTKLLEVLQAIQDKTSELFSLCTNYSFSVQAGKG